MRMCIVMEKHCTECQHSMPFVLNDINVFFFCVSQYIMWLSSQVADFFETGILNLVPQYDMCLNSGGDYTEK
jgi:hypothetical protein